MKRPTEFRMRKVTLPRLVSAAKERQEEGLAKVSTWTITLDGWTDVSGNSIYAVMMLHGAQQHYIGSLELSRVRHIAANLLTALDDMLKADPNRMRQVAAIITDSASTLNKLRTDFCSKNTRVQNLSCVLHGINLMCKDLLRCKYVKESAAKLTSLVVFFCKSEHWKQELMAWGKLNGVTRFLSRNVETRWYSYIEMAKNALLHKEGFQHCLTLYNNERDRHSKINSEIVQIIKSDIFESVEMQAKLLEPMAKAIGVLESTDATLGDVWICLFKLISHYKYLNGENELVKFNKMVNILLKSICKRANNYMGDIYIICFFLCPNYRVIATSKSILKEKCGKWLVVMQWDS